MKTRRLVVALGLLVLTACLPAHVAPVVHRAEPRPRSEPGPIPRPAVAPGELTLMLVDAGVPSLRVDGMRKEPNPVLSVAADGVPLSHFAAELAKLTKLDLHVEAEVADLPITIRARSLTLQQLRHELRSDWLLWPGYGLLRWNVPELMRGDLRREPATAALDVRPELADSIARLLVAFGLHGDETAEAVDDVIIVRALPEQLGWWRHAAAVVDAQATDLSVESVSCRAAPPKHRIVDYATANDAGRLNIERAPDGEPGEYEDWWFGFTEAQRRLRFRVSSEGVPLHRFAMALARLADLELQVDPDVANVPVNVNGPAMTLRDVLGAIYDSARVAPSKAEAEPFGHKLPRIRSVAASGNDYRRRRAAARSLKTVAIVFARATLAAGTAAQLCSMASQSAAGDLDAVATVGNVLVVRGTHESLRLAQNLGEVMSRDEPLHVEHLEPKAEPAR